MNNDNKKGSFVFYDSFFETLQALDMEDRESANMLYRAIALYGLYRIEPQKLTNIQKAIFAGMRAQLEANWIKYENGKKGAGFGKLGGAPKGNSNARKTTPKQPQDNPETTRNVNENENVNENVECKGVCKGESDKPIPVATKRRAFVAPQLEEVANFFSTIKGTRTDAKRFFFHHEATGWRTSKGPMKSWTAAARKWMLNEPRFSNAKAPETSCETQPRYTAL